jgi:hypothetical protein
MELLGVSYKIKMGHICGIRIYPSVCDRPNNLLGPKLEDCLKARYGEPCFERFRF